MNNQVIFTKPSCFHSDLKHDSFKLFNSLPPFPSPLLRSNSKIFSEDQLLDALWQIIHRLRHDLNNEIIKNNVLTKIIQANKNSCVKIEECNQIQVKQQKEEKVSQQQNSTKWMKKQTKNDTKNISKNFGKAIITFILKKPQKVIKILEKHKIDYSVFKNELKERKKNLISIKELRSLWLEDQFQYAQAFRQISAQFLRKASFKYIFGSRINDYIGHLKYRNRLLEALRKPSQFNSIKQ